MSELRISDDDPTEMSDAELQSHAEKWAGLKLVQPGPLPTPEGHPDLDDDARLSWRTV